IIILAGLLTVLFVRSFSMIVVIVVIVVTCVAILCVGIAFLALLILRILRDFRRLKRRTLDLWTLLELFQNPLQLFMLCLRLFDRCESEQYVLIAVETGLLDGRLYV